MSAAPAIEGRAASSLGERLYIAVIAAADDRRPEPFRALSADVQSRFDRAAVSFVASLSYTESEGVREALISSVLAEELRWIAIFAQVRAGDSNLIMRKVARGALETIVRRAAAAIAQAEGAR